MLKPLSKYKCTRPVDNVEEHFNVADEDRAIEELFEKFVVMLIMGQIC